MLSSAPATKPPTCAQNATPPPCAPIATRPAHELDQEPVAEHEVRGHRERRHVETQWDKQVHVHARVQQDVRAHHAADRTRGADHRDDGVGIECRLQRRGGDAAEQVEDDEAHMPHRVLDVVAEEPEEPHVADQVHPAAVQEHRGQDGVPGAAAAGQRADGVGADREARARGCGAQDVRRYQAEAADGGGKRGLHAEALQQDPGEDVQPIKPYVTYGVRKCGLSSRIGNTGRL